ALMLHQAVLQQQVIESQQQLIAAQKQVIALQKKLQKKTPKNPRDAQVYWHIASGGIMSTEAANSKDLATVRKFQEWNENFAEKFVKPYVSPKVYAECVNQMTRGLPERIAGLETQKELRIADNGHKPKVNVTPIG